MALPREMASHAIESTDPITKHRLELLERTVYALQAQHRLLEYRIQYIEGQTKASRPQENQETSADKQPPVSIESHQTVYTHRPRDSSDLDPFSVHEEPAEEHSASQTITLPKRSVSQSILDEPSPISTPVLTPARMKRSVSSLRYSSAKALPFIPAHVEVSIKSPTEVKEISNISTTEELETSQPAKPPKTHVPWDGTISWKFLSLFKDAEEERDAMQNSALMVGQGRLEDQWIFQYGLRYLPKANDNDAYRTVRIEGLPQNITMDKVLAEVCYGEVYSIDLLNTIDITGYHTARLVFLHQQSAVNFCKHARKHGVYIEGVRIRATRERTATYPIGLRMQEAIDKHDCTRCVRIDNVDSSLLVHARPLIEKSFLKYSTEVLDQEGETIRIRFHSMKAASFAFDMFKNHSAFQHCTMDYEKDPCNRIPAV